MRENSRQLQQKHAGIGYVRCLILVHTTHSFLLNPSDASTTSKPKIWPVLKITWEFNITLCCLWCLHYGVFLGTLKWHQCFKTAHIQVHIHQRKTVSVPKLLAETGEKDDLFLFYMSENTIVILKSVNSCQCLMYHCLKSLKVCNQCLASFWLDLWLYSTPWYQCLLSEICLALVTTHTSSSLAVQVWFASQMYNCIKQQLNSWFTSLDTLWDSKRFLHISANFWKAGLKLLITIIFLLPQVS